VRPWNLAYGRRLAAGSSPGRHGVSGSGDCGSSVPPAGSQPGRKRNRAGAPCRSREAVLVDTSADADLDHPKQVVTGGEAMQRQAAR